jgi:hypothetical protein
MQPIKDLLGTRASMLAELQFVDCFVGESRRVGGLGFGCSIIAANALDYGRYSVAWGCVGLAQAALEASVRHTRSREQSGKAIKDHDLVRRMITNMFTDTQAARLLCFNAGRGKDLGGAFSRCDVAVAKYFASRALTQATADAVQLHGALGCSADAPVQRYFRDARITEIIEGTTQSHQVGIAHYVYEEPV